MEPLPSLSLNPSEYSRPRSTTGGTSDERKTTRVALGSLGTPDSSLKRPRSSTCSEELPPSWLAFLPKEEDPSPDPVGAPPFPSQNVLENIFLEPVKEEISNPAPSPTFRVVFPRDRNEAWIQECFESCEIHFKNPLAERLVSTGEKSGTNDSYFALNSRKEKIGVIKPSEKEVGTGDPEEKMFLRPKDGIEAGTCVRREVVASVLFPKHVPSTLLAETTSPGIERVSLFSLQQFAPDCESFSEFKKKDAVCDQLGAIAMIDLCLNNTDRNSKNLLVRTAEGKHELIPIDHGCILTDNCLSNGRFAWYPYLPDDMPFSPEDQSVIAALDLEMCIQTVLDAGLTNRAANTLATSLLLTKFLATKVPIKSIAKYYIRDYRQLDTPETLIFSILNIAAHRQYPTLGRLKNLNRLVDTRVISEVIHEITTFILGKKDPDALNITAQIVSLKNSFDVAQVEEEYKTILEKSYS